VTPSARGVLLSALLIAAASPLVMVWSWERDQVDQCVNGGGSFNYEAMACDRTKTHSYVSFRARHPRLMNLTYLGGVILLVVGVATNPALRRTESR
jgi:hypothetical protein